MPINKVRGFLDQSPIFVRWILNIWYKSFVNSICCIYSRVYALWGLETHPQKCNIR